MPRDLRLVCDRCFAFRGFTTALREPCVPADLREDAEIGPFVVEHDDCQPPLRVTDLDDTSVELYREFYEEA
jgi:hypothetical protein